MYDLWAMLSNAVWRTLLRMSTTTTEPRLPGLLLADLAQVEDRYALYSEWRRAGLLVKGGPGVWIVSGHAEVVLLLRDRRVVQRS